MPEKPAQEKSPIDVGRLLSEHWEELRQYARRQVGPIVGARESPSDVAQSTCREVLEHLDRFRYDGEEGFKSWLYRTALRKIQSRHRFLRAARRDVRREAVLDKGHPSELASLLRVDPGASPSEIAAGAERCDRVREIVAQLPGRQRDVIELAIFQGLPHAQIGESLGMPPAHVRVLLFRTLARIGSRLRTQRPV